SVGRCGEAPGKGGGCRSGHDKFLESLHGYANLTETPPENIESCTSNAAGWVPGGTSNAAFTWIELPGLIPPMGVTPVFIHMSASQLAAYWRPLTSITFWFCAK